MNIKIIYFLLGITLSNFSFSQNFWERIPSPTENFLRTLYFIDSTKGWVAGDSGVIFYTSDGGANWTQQETNTLSKMMKLFFLDENKGWALAWSEGENVENNFIGTEILQTTDGGQNWSLEKYRENEIFLRAVYFLDTLKGFMGGSHGKFLVTTDGGLNWEPANIDSGVFAAFPVIDFNFYSDSYGFACGGKFDIAGVVWRTTNAGDSWTPIDPQYTPPDEVWDVHFFDSLHVMGVGGDPDFFGVGLIHSTDAGETWDYFEIGIYGRALAVSFRTDNEGWAVVPQSELFVTTFDYGYNWTPYMAPDSSNLYDIFFTDTLTGYAVGQEGVIVKYKYKIPDKIESENNFTPNEFVLNQNFPNPFNSTTTISYNIKNPARVTIRIFNVLGIHVATIVDEYKPSGSFSVSWKANDLSSGVYYIQMNADGNLITKKMVLLK